MTFARLSLFTNGLKEHRNFLTDVSALADLVASHQMKQTRKADKQPGHIVSLATGFDRAV
jgi:hypothetical protein